MAILDISINEMKNVIDAIKQNYNFDFSNYAYSSLRRRILHIIELDNLNSPAELITKIKSDRNYFSGVLKKITVNTTEMFRDPSFWMSFKNKVIGNLGANPSIRIWHAGCSTGEEVYSMCIALHEAGLLEKSIIHASDINEDVLEIAKKGVYDRRYIDTYKPNYNKFNTKGNFEDYFDIADNKCTVKPFLRNNLKFFSNDLVKASPLIKYDVILCRNLMIYFNSQLQNDVVNLFRDSLYNKGIFCIGHKETIAFTEGASSFETLDLEEKIFIKKS
jgi:chemotaxis protein methyltransferase CheR